MSLGPNGDEMQVAATGKENVVSANATGTDINPTVMKADRPCVRRVEP